MAGYMLASRPGVIVPPPGGWHDTGDIVAIEDGFITICGRAKRFAKIGGEMISLAAVETMAAAIWPESQHVALSAPDPRKGEQLILVTDKLDADKHQLLQAARAQGSPSGGPETSNGRGDDPGSGIGKSRSAGHLRDGAPRAERWCLRHFEPGPSAAVVAVAGLTNQICLPSGCGQPWRREHVITIEINLTVLGVLTSP